MKKIKIAIIGASGAVGKEIIKILEEESVIQNIEEIIPIASKRNANKKINYKNKVFHIQELNENIFNEKNIDIAFFSAGSEISKNFVPFALKNKILVIDNTSYFRMDENTPLVVPEVNEKEIFKNRGIISNPNCSTIQLVQVLNPLHENIKIKRVDVSTYQAVSGAGSRGVVSLINETKEIMEGIESRGNSIFPHRIGFNLIPHIDVFLNNSYTKEEMKLVNETHKIMNVSFEISATCVRVPIIRSHSESISIKFNRKTNANEVKEILKNAKNIKLIDNVENNEYPMPYIADSTDYTYVGRIREDNFDKRIIHLWCVADQLRVGAATNALKIAKIHLFKNSIKKLNL